MLVNLMRTHQRWMMFIISVLVILSMVWFYGNGRSQYNEGSGGALVGHIYGRELGNTEFERSLRMLTTAQNLRLTNLIQPDLMDRGDVFLTATNFLVLQHEASLLGIDPTAQEVEAAEKKLSVFQAPDGSGFDPGLRDEFAAKNLAPRGFGLQQLDELVRADIQVGRLRQVIDSTVMLSPTEVRAEYEQYFGKTNASVIRLKTADFAAGAAEPTDDEIKKYYDEQKDHFQHPEKRKAQYVFFGLDEKQAKLTGKERVEAMKPHNAEAETFLEKVLDGKGKADFAALAREAGATVVETPEFEEAAAGSFPEASIPEFVQTVFKLTKAEPDSDALVAPAGYYILHLSGLTPAMPLTLDEARPKIVSAIKEDRAKTALTAKAEEIRAKIAEALKAGKPIADAAKDAGQTAQDVPTFSPGEPNATFPDAGLVTNAALELNAGELGKFVPAPEGGLLVYVRDRQPVDEAVFEKQKDRITSSMALHKKRMAFLDWLHSRRDVADIRMAGPGGGGEVLF